MSKIVIIGAGAMGSAFSLPCLDNNHDVNIVGTHLENDFIDDFQANENLHAGLKTKIPQEIKVFKFDKFDQVLKSNVDLIVLGISSKGIEWVADQLVRVYSGKQIPNLLMLTKGLSIHKNNYELLVDKLQRLLLEKGITKTNISAVGGPCLAAGLANRVHSSVVIANKDIKTAKKIADMLNTNYYHTSFSDDLNGVEVSAAIKNIFSMAVGAARGLCSRNISDEGFSNLLNVETSKCAQNVHTLLCSFLNQVRSTKSSMLLLDLPCLQVIEMRMTRACPTAIKFLRFKLHTAIFEHTDQLKYQQTPDMYSRFGVNQVFDHLSWPYYKR